MARTDTKNVEFRFDDGEVVREKCRDTWGGWVNMIDRVERRFGTRVRVTDEGHRFELVGTDRHGDCVVLIEIVPGHLVEVK